jgi:antitoxin component of RelBE/YafQ-DinJ toxin-antitoxin module
MRSAVVNFKTEPKIKDSAQKLAAAMSLDLSDILNIALRNFISSRVVYLDLSAEGEPSAWLAKTVAAGRREAVGKGLSPRFKSAKSAIKWLKS